MKKLRLRWCVYTGAILLPLVILCVISSNFRLSPLQVYKSEPKEIYVYTNCSQVSRSVTESEDEKERKLLHQHQEGSQFLNETSGMSSQQAKTNTQRKRVEYPESSHDVSVSTRKGHGYVVAFNLSVNGKQDTGLDSFVSLQCLLGSFKLPMYIVQPFIQDSVVHILPQNASKASALSDFFNLDYYNIESRRQGWAKAVRWPQFLKFAPRNVIMVQMENVTNCNCHDGRKYKSSNTSRHTTTWSSNRVTMCKNVSASGPLGYLEKELGFCIVRVVTTNPQPVVSSAKDMYNVIFGAWTPEEVTLIFQSWCPGMYIPNPALVNPARCSQACSGGMEGILKPSQKLLNHIQRYETSYSESGSRFKVAVMLQTRQILSTLTKQKSLLKMALQTCLDTASKSVCKFQKTHGPCTPFVMADIGTYGSEHWRKAYGKVEGTQLEKKIKDSVCHLLNSSIDFDGWQKRLTISTEGVSDKGYLAVIQKSIASRADCLVLLGGGKYLRRALYEYLIEHPDTSAWCVQLVCLDYQSMNEYDATLLSLSGPKGSTQWQTAGSNIPLYMGTYTSDLRS